MLTCWLLRLAFGSWFGFGLLVSVGFDVLLGFLWVLRHVRCVDFVGCCSCEFFSGVGLIFVGVVLYSVWCLE